MNLERLRSLRVYLIGPWRIGRSSILERYILNTIRDEHYVDYTRINYKYRKDFHEHDISYMYNLYQIFQPSHSNFIQCCYDNVLLFYNITHRSEFEDIQEIAKKLEEVKKNNEKKPLVYLVGNISNKKRKREVSEDEAIDFCTKYDYKYFECSALTGHNIHEIFGYIARDIIEKDLNSYSNNKLLKKKKCIIF